VGERSCSFIFSVFSSQSAVEEVIKFFIYATATLESRENEIKEGVIYATTYD
jgi:hypothetical protein